MTPGQTAREAAGAWRWIASLVWLLVAAPVSAEPAPGPPMEWEVTVRLEWPDMDRLEETARKCGARRVERHKDARGEWLSVGVAHENSRTLSCLVAWIEALPDYASARVPDHALQAQKAFVFAVAGSAHAMVSMAGVARRCGFARVERKPLDRDEILVLVHDVDWDATPRDPRLACVYHWMFTDPDEGLRLVVRTPAK